MRFTGIRQEHSAFTRFARWPFGRCALAVRNFKKKAEAKTVYQAYRRGNRVVRFCELAMREPCVRTGNDDFSRFCLGRASGGQSSAHQTLRQALAPSEGRCINFLLPLSPSALYKAVPLMAQRESRHRCPSIVKVETPTPSLMSNPLMDLSAQTVMQQGPSSN